MDAVDFDHRLRRGGGKAKWRCGGVGHEMYAPGCSCSRRRRAGPASGLHLKSRIRSQALATLTDDGLPRVERPKARGCEEEQIEDGDDVDDRNGRRR